MDLRPICDVLVVDDDMAIREALRELLEDAGYQVAAAAHGHDALRQLQAGLRPSLIVLDWKMPVMDGAQFLLAQQHDPALAAIPVAVASAQTFAPGTEVVDVDAFLCKPFDVRHLLATIDQFCPT
jgi:CheY-like chemotaxis protein